MKALQKDLIRKTRIKYLGTTVMGFVFVAFVAMVGFYEQRTIIKQQESFYDIYHIFSNQMRLIQRIGFISERLTNVNDFGELTSLKKDYRIATEQFRNNYRLLDFWVKKRGGEFHDIGQMLSEYGLDDEMSQYMANAVNLLRVQDLSKAELQKSIDYLARNARSDLADKMNIVLKQVDYERDKNIKLFTYVNYSIVGISFLTIFVFWLFVFRPLFNTIFKQHEELVNAILTSEAAHRSKTEFLANISHEIRTPMTAIIGYMDVLRDSNSGEDEKQKAVEVIQGNSQNLLRIIDDILDISKMEIADLNIDCSRVDLKKLVTDIYNLLNIKALAKAINMKFIFEDEVPRFIETDATRFKQIIFNIVGNSIKFTNRGGVVVRFLFEGIEEPKLRVIVEDTGVGIAPGQAAKLFNPFVQADNTISRKFGGTGLGLVMSKRLAEKLGGDVRLIKSELQKGSTFEVTIGAGNFSAETIEPGSHFEDTTAHIPLRKLPEQVLATRNVLVVDDAIENSQLFKIYLEKAGASVTVANDGFQALNFVKEKKFDAILLDLQMPDKDGYQVLKEIKNMEFLGPVIALTAHAMPEEKEKTKRAGFTDHVVKPVKAQELVRRVQEHLVL